jgi:hypothetical protein
MCTVLAAKSASTAHSAARVTAPASVNSLSDTGNPQKVFCCHAYNCQFRGSLLTLMHGWLTGTRPTGDRLKGEEFKRVRGVLAGEANPPLSTVATRAAQPVKAPERTRNIPLGESPNEKARELETLDV